MNFSLTHACVLISIPDSMLAPGVPQSLFTSPCYRAILVGRLCPIPSTSPVPEFHFIFPNFSDSCITQPCLAMCSLGLLVHICFFSSFLFSTTYSFLSWPDSVYWPDLVWTPPDSTGSAFLIFTKKTSSVIPRSGHVLIFIQMYLLYS